MMDPRDAALESASIRCLRCDQPLDRGYLVDHGYGVTYPVAWVAGKPEWSRWTGLKLKNRRKMPVTTLRCPRCGRLESFALDGPWPG
jgi:hypothetical protein